MSRRNSLSRFVVPFVGAAVFAAGTLLLQVGRKPSQAPERGPERSTTGRAVPQKGTGDNQVAVAESTGDETLLRRLRERGL